MSTPPASSPSRRVRSLDPDARFTLGILAALVALGPLSIDMYLPAMPAMQRALGTDVAGMHLTLSAYLWGFAVFHLLCGPLADRFGRRPLLIAGTSLFVLAAAGCALSSSVEQLTLFRFLQGVGACVGPTLARTITRDVFGPRRSARALSLIAMLMALAPAIAPGLGGIMLRYVPWPSLFLFLACYGVAVLGIVVFYIPETLRIPQSLHPVHIARNYLQLLRDPVFLPVAAASALAYGGLMVYLACSGFVFIDMLGIPVEFFGLIFLTTVIGYMGGSALSARLALDHQPAALLVAGCGLAAGSTLAMLLLHLAWSASVLALVLPMTLFAAALGIVMPQAMALSLEHFPHIAATNTALFGFMQMSLSAVITAGVGTVLAASPMPMIITMAVCTALALGLVLRLRSQPHAPGADDELSQEPETA
jgi:DHA1 family bicyclomycin/chloramphenicol resistance-like MFS transporter